ncbi:MAG: UvrD-helicase domain-containing protein [Bacteroidaceae bacterium]|nr:UvrD-helicase domain-containing protein [Bacteroidaceae bacterium]MBQ9642377.1 UvrD-helicase domain-containing protein [Bacteroidaceae bacterium]
MRPLKLYRASAGSGKTFTLAVEYIKLLIINQWEYKHILAVTFTNKATAEMKERILSTLYGLTHGLESASGYMNVIKEAEEIKALHISDDEIRRRAGIALGNLAHDYSRFHIETIDSFFISVIKDLARELDLTANLNIDLNATDVLDEAVDNIIDSLQEGSETFRNIKDFIQEKIDAESNWKIDQEVKDFGLNIFNEHYLAKSYLIASKIQDSQFMASYRKQLRAAKAEVLRQTKGAAEEFLHFCEAHGYTAENFKQKERGVWGFFNKLAQGKELPEPNSYVLKCLESKEQWSKDATLCELAESALMPLLQNLIAAMPKARQTLSTVSAISQHLSHLQLLHAISQQVEQLNNDANRFLLANSAHFLQRMIDKSNVPFIYEKSGARFNHIMIDEFQDTSALQWSNFLPLLSNSLDAAQSCLVVGDVKQSIYRFRNSDWQILNTLGDVPELSGKIEEHHLAFNRRSLGNIIHFNNAFFQNATSALNEDYRQAHDGQDSTQLLKAYSDVEQQQLASKQGQGYVRIEILQKEEDEDPPDYEALTLDRLVSYLQELTGQGIAQRDITILLRYNRHIPLISRHIAIHAPSIHLVSDEAFQLKASATVNAIILALKYLVNADDKYTLAQLADICLSLQSPTAAPKLSDLLLTDTAQLEALLPPAYIEGKHTLVFEPLKELIEKIYVIFQLDRIHGQDAYLFYFHDQIAAFTEDMKADPVSFLNYWDETLSVKTIPGSVDDGVRIMSIHKSKGLEFHTVIIPFCDWTTLGKPSELLWCTPTETPYDQLKLIPVGFNKTTQESIFAADYENEVLLNNVDNLNLLYVAFTRAVNNLLIITQSCESAGKKSDSTGTVKDIRRLIARSLPDFMASPEADGTGTLEYGTLVTTHEEKLTTDDNVLTQPYQKEYIQFQTSDTLPQFRQSNKSKDFIAQFSDSPTTPTTYIDRGLLYHAIFQEINTLQDIDRVIDKMNMEGHFHSLAEQQEVSQHVHAALSDTFAARWFTDQWQVVNERAILTPTATGQWQEYRADRVIMSPTETIVIDYKTGHPRPEHKEQVRTYMNLLQQMGYPNVKGYVWYIMSGKTYSVEMRN